VETFGPNQITLAITEVDKSLIFFRGSDELPFTPSISAMNCVDATGFRGIAIATDLESAKTVVSMPGPILRYFLVWDLEWMRGEHGKTHQELCYLYRNPSLPLIARSEYHREVIEKCWNRSVRAVVNDRFQEIVELISVDLFG
jgi:hypothetical protein